MDDRSVRIVQGVLRQGLHGSINSIGSAICRGQVFFDQGDDGVFEAAGQFALNDRGFSVLIGAAAYTDCDPVFVGIFDSVPVQDGSACPAQIGALAELNGDRIDCYFFGAGHSAGGDGDRRLAFFHRGDCGGLGDREFADV